VVTPGEVDKVVDAFLGVVLSELLNTRPVRIPNFGSFSVRASGNTPRRIMFHQDAVITGSMAYELKGEVVEKYGVEEDKKDPKVKTAAEKGTCPQCGATLEKTASVHKCPTHGTEPFEKKGAGDGSKT
jgi:hypothetical protein